MVVSISLVSVLNYQGSNVLSFRIIFIMSSKDDLLTQWDHCFLFLGHNEL